jgi:hypothetical protein
MFEDGNCLSGERQRRQPTKLPLRKIINGVSGEEKDILGQE